ncbi:MAG: sulfite exporter TauE/SafE family protein [Bacilli bacterium]
MEYFLLVCIGLFAGVIGSLVGLGGGIIVVPALINIALFTPYFDLITPQTAVGTSMVTTIATAVSSSLMYRKRGTIDYRTALILFVGSFPGSILGAKTNGLFDFSSFNIFFGMFLIFVSLILMFQHTLPKKTTGWKYSSKREMTLLDGSHVVYEFQPYLAVFLSLFVGWIGSLFGIGGGSLLVPMMIVLFNFPPHIAVATSMFSIMLTSTVSSVTHISMGNVEWSYLVFLLPSAYIGAKVGSMLNARLASKTVVLVLRLVLIFLGVRMFLQGL